MKPAKTSDNDRSVSPIGRYGKWLCALIVLGFGLRIYGVHFGLPYLYHADEPIVVNHALAYGSGDLNPHFFKIPPLLSYLLFGFYCFSFLIAKAAGIFSSASDFENLFFRDPTFFYLSARVLSGVLPGAASIFLIDRLARKHFSSHAAVLSALFLSVCFLHVRDSHYIYPDILLVLLLILIFQRIFLVVDHPENSWAHIFTGLLLGAACAFKYNAAAFSIPYFAAVWMNRKRVGAGRFFLTGLIAILTFLLFNPYALLDFGTFRYEIAEQSRSQGGTPWLHHLRHSLLNGVGPAALLFAFAGCFRALMRPDRKKILFALFAVSYYLVLVKAGQPYDRYVLPLLVPVLFFAADFVAGCASGRGPGRALSLILAALVIVPNFIHSFLFARVMTATDTRTQAKEWVETNIPAGSAVALGWEFYLPRLSFSEKQLLLKKVGLQTDGDFSGARARRLDFYLRNPAAKTYDLFFLRTDAGKDKDRPLLATPTLPYDFEELRARGIEYVLLPVVADERKPSEFYAQLNERADRVERFSPYKDTAVDAPLDPQPLTGGPFLWKDLAARERNGVPIEIYKLRRG